MQANNQLKSTTSTFDTFRIMDNVHQVRLCKGPVGKSVSLLHVNMPCTRIIAVVGIQYSLIAF